MLCEKCHEREGVVDRPGSAFGWSVRLLVCVECAMQMERSLYAPGVLNGYQRNVSMMRAAIEPVANTDSRFRIDAYEFVYEAMIYSTLERFEEADPPKSQISALEILEALQRLAVVKYGKQARKVLNGWVSIVAKILETLCSTWCRLACLDLVPETAKTISSTATI